MTLKTTMKTVTGSQHLNTLREQKGFSQQELADRADISRSMVAQIEMGERQPSRKILSSIGVAMALTDIETQELMAAFQYLPEGQPSDQVAALLRADKNLPDEQIERITKLIREAYEKIQK